ncbi:MAG: VOC family protein, partial [Alphaproteobacteria bacterium]|nr:VOC family protein [Alphaproteobacteria bacterium]
MGRGIVDTENMERADIAALRDTVTPKGLPFRVAKLGHVVLKVQDLERSVEFYAQVLGFQVSDVYPETMVPGRMVFLRCNPDHHCLALVGGAKGPNSFAELHHLAFEVASLD